MTLVLIHALPQENGAPAKPYAVPRPATAIPVQFSILKTSEVERQEGLL